jgi:DNA repair protein RadC
MESKNCFALGQLLTSVFRLPTFLSSKPDIRPLTRIRSAQWYRLKINGEPDAYKKLQGSSVKKMQKNLVIVEQVCDSNLAEIEIKYSTRVKPSEMQKVVTSADAYQVLKQIYPNLEHREYFYMLCLNRNNKVLGYSLISMGGLSGTVVDVRIIFQTALKSSCCSLILSHNHPSGNLVPSEAYKDINKKIKEAGKFLDIPVLDHLILTPETYLSFADEGLM